MSTFWDSIPAMKHTVGRLLMAVSRHTQLRVIRIKKAADRYRTGIEFIARWRKTTPSKITQCGKCRGLCKRDARNILCSLQPMLWSRDFKTHEMAHHIWVARNQFFELANFLAFKKQLSEKSRVLASFHDIFQKLMRLFFPQTYHCTIFKAGVFTQHDPA